MNNLEEDQITTEGYIILMRFIITDQEERIEQFQKSAVHNTHFLKDMNVYSNELVNMLNAEKIVNHYRDKMMFEYVINARI